MERQAIVGFVLAVIVLLMLAGAATRATSSLLETNRLVAHTYSVLAALKDVEASLNLAIASHRGFVVTGLPDYLADRDAALARLTSTVGALRGLTRDNPRQQALLDQLEDQVRQRRSSMDEVTRRLEADGIGSARGALLDTDPVASDGTLSSTLAAMESAERDLLAARRAGDERSYAHMASSFSALGGSVILLLGVLAWRIHKGAGSRERLDDALRRANSFLESIFENIPNMIFIKDAANLRFVRINRAGEALVGIGREDLVGRSDHDFFPRSQALFFEEMDRQALSAPGVTVIPEEKIATRGGGTHWLRTQKLSIHENGVPAFLLGISEDITERKRVEDELRASKAQLQALFESLPGLYLILTPDFRIVTASDAYLQATMTRRDDIVGRGLFEVFPDNPDDPKATGTANLRASLDRVLATSATDVMAIQKYDVRRPDGEFEERFWSPVNSPLVGPDGRIEFIIHRAEDVTDFVRHKSDQVADDPGLRVRFEQMEAEIYQSGQKLQAANRQLQAANAELEAFSYSVSHDLRAPLRAIDGFSKALAEDCGPSLDAEGRAHLQRIQAAAGRMGELIDDMLSLSQVARADMDRRAVNVTELAERVLRDFREREPERQVELEVQRDLTVEADPRLLRIALENLLGNAWKFTRRTTTPRIEVGREEHDGRTVFHVRDNGAGFDPAYVTKLFGVFQRLHKPTDFEGTGIGLAIVQRIIARHGGQVWAEGQPDKGATFYFTLDCAETMA